MTLGSQHVYPNYGIVGGGDLNIHTFSNKYLVFSSIDNLKTIYLVVTPC